MILPIVAYGHPILKKVAADITPDYPELKEFIDSMWETLYACDGLGLAAPQVNRSIRVIVIDITPHVNELPANTVLKRVLINPHIIEEEGEEWPFNEGCLSIPDIHEDVMRKPNLRIKYLDEQFVEHDERYDDIMARVIQHEYDHLEGVLFVDRLSPLRKIMLKRKLTDIVLGKIKPKYRMIFAPSVR
ncbi:MAG: peptide deformylase, partial [Bacteroidota bacterium]|nr:peptide deformylase [Bacteroidota bacterium]